MFLSNVFDLIFSLGPSRAAGCFLFVCMSVTIVV